MKKKYLYVLAPLIGVVVFSGFYISARKDYDDREEAVVRKARETKQAKLEKEAADRKVAVEAALKLQDQRRLEKKEREDREAKEAEARAAAVQARTRANNDAKKLEDKVKTLQRDIDDEKKEITKLEADKKHSQDEAAFLLQYVGQADANVKNLTGVLDKIAEADKQWEAAQKAAAAAATKK